MTSAITRRAALVGAIRSSVALAGVGFRAAHALPAAAAEPAFDLQLWLDSSSIENVIDYHITKLTEAMQKLHGGGYRGAVDKKSGVAVVVAEPGFGDGFYIDFRHEGTANG